MVFRLKICLVTNVADKITHYTHNYTSTHLRQSYSLLRLASVSFVFAENVCFLWHSGSKAKLQIKKKLNKKSITLKTALVLQWAISILILLLSRSPPLVNRFKRQQISDVTEIHKASQTLITYFKMSKSRNIKTTLNYCW